MFHRTPFPWKEKFMLAFYVLMISSHCNVNSIKIWSSHWPLGEPLRITEFFNLFAHVTHAPRKRKKQIPSTHKVDNKNDIIQFRISSAYAYICRSMSSGSLGMQMLSHFMHAYWSRYSQAFSQRNIHSGQISRIIKMDSRLCDELRARLAFSAIHQ